MTPWTQSDLNAYMARRGNAYNDLRGVVAKVDKEDVLHERDLHDQIIEECKRRQWIALHGSTAHSTMRTVGENDFHCLLPNGRVLFIECKTSKGKLSTEQLGMQKWMAKLGHKMHIVRAFSEFLKLTEQCLAESSASSPSLTTLNHPGVASLSVGANAGERPPGMGVL